MASIGDLVLNLQANTQSLDNASKSINRMMQRLARLNIEVSNLSKSTQQGFTAMASAIEKSNRKTESSTKKAGNEFKKLDGKITDLSKSIQVALGPLSGVASRLTAIASLANRNTLAIAGLIGGTIAIGSIFKKASELGQAFESDMLKINQQLKATGLESRMTAKELDKLAVSLGDKTLTSAQEARKAISVILGFPNVARNNMQRVLEMSQNLSVVMGGNLTLNARRLARALEDPKNSLDTLRRAGVFFTDLEKEWLDQLTKTNRELEAQNYILDKLNGIAGAAEAQAGGLAGAYDSLAEAVKIYLEQLAVGSGFNEALKEIIVDLTKVFKDFSSGMTSASEIGKLFSYTVYGLGKAVVFLAKNLDYLLYTFGLFTAFRSMKIAFDSLLKISQVSSDKTLPILARLIAAFKALHLTVKIWGTALMKTVAPLLAVAAAMGFLVTQYLREQAERKQTIQDIRDEIDALSDLNAAKKGLLAEVPAQASNLINLKAQESMLDKAEKVLRKLEGQRTKKPNERLEKRIKEAQEKVDRIQAKVMELTRISEDYTIGRDLAAAADPEVIQKAHQKSIDDTASSFRDLFNAAYPGSKAIEEVNKNFKTLETILKAIEADKNLLGEIFNNEALKDVLPWITSVKDLQNYLEDFEKRLNPTTAAIMDQTDSIKESGKMIGLYGLELHKAKIEQEKLNAAMKITGLPAKHAKAMLESALSGSTGNPLYGQLRTMAAEVDKQGAANYDNLIAKEAESLSRVSDKLEEQAKHLNKRPEIWERELRLLDKVYARMASGMSETEAREFRQKDIMNEQIESRQKFLRHVTDENFAFQDQLTLLEAGIKYSNMQVDLRDIELALVKERIKLENMPGSDPKNVEKLLDQKRKELEYQRKLNAVNDLNAKRRALKDEYDILQKNIEYQWVGANIREREASLLRQRIELIRAGNDAQEVDKYLDAQREMVRLQEQFNTNLEATNSMTETFASGMEGVLDVLLDLGKGTEDLKDALHSLWMSMRKEWIKLGIVNPILNQVTDGNRPQIGGKGGSIEDYFKSLTLGIWGGKPKEGDRKTQKQALEEILSGKEVSTDIFKKVIESEKANIDNENSLNKLSGAIDFFGSSTKATTDSVIKMGAAASETELNVGDLGTALSSSIFGGSKGIVSGGMFGGCCCCDPLMGMGMGIGGGRGSGIGSGIFEFATKEKEDKFNSNFADFTYSFDDSLMEGVAKTDKTMETFNGVLGEGFSNFITGMGEVAYQFLNGFGSVFANILMNLSRMGGGGGRSLFGTILGAIGNAFAGSAFGLGMGDAMGDMGIGYNFWSAAGGHSIVMGDPMLQPHGFATGGSFKVGGSGGTDSQLVSFRASPGEMVEISQNGSQMGRSPGNIYNIDASGVDPGQMDRLIRTIKELDKSVEPRAIRATAGARRRDPSLFGGGSQR